MFYPDVNYYIDPVFLPNELRQQIDESDCIRFKYSKNKTFEFFKKDSSILWDHNPTRKMLENAYPNENDAIRKIKEYEDLSQKYSYMAEELRYEAGLQDIVLDDLL